MAKLRDPEGRRRLGAIARKASIRRKGAAMAGAESTCVLLLSVRRKSILHPFQQIRHELPRDSRVVDNLRPIEFVQRRQFTQLGQVFRAALQLLLQVLKESLLGPIFEIVCEHVGVLEDVAAFENLFSGSGEELEVDPRSVAPRFGVQGLHARVGCSFLLRGEAARRIVVVEALIVVQVAIELLLRLLSGGSRRARTPVGILRGRCSLRIVAIAFIIAPRLIAVKLPILVANPAPFELTAATSWSKERAESGSNTENERSGSPNVFL